MNREYKFRAWETNKGLGSRMSKPFTLADVHNNGLGHFGDSYEFMQYTGLKDKTRTKEFPEGKEIYEGDIIKNYQAESNTVIWFEGCWCMQNYHAGALELSHYNKESVIIGNIHENPELLK